MSSLDLTINNIPEFQTAALVRKLGGPIEFVNDYPVRRPGSGEVLAKILYSGVCQSDLQTKNGTAANSNGQSVSEVKLPHIGGHEGVARIVLCGPNVAEEVRVGQLVGIRFISHVCHQCEFCRAGDEQYCVDSRTHLHYDDGAFQEYIILDAEYLTILPDDIDPSTLGPVLCAGVTAYKGVIEANVKDGQWVVVIGASGGIGHFAVQYAMAHGAQVIGIDGGDEKGKFISEVLKSTFVDFQKYTSEEIISHVNTLTGGGAHAVIVATGNSIAYEYTAKILRVGGSLSCVGIPLGKDVHLMAPIAQIVIKGLRIAGSLVGSRKECLEAIEYVRNSKVKPFVIVRLFKELPQIYEEMTKGQILGRIVVKFPEVGSLNSTAKL